MNKTKNCSENTAESMAKGMAEAREVLEQVAGLIDAEWKRFLDTIDSAPVPDPVKTAFAQADSAFDNVRKEAKGSAEDWSTDVSNAVDELRDLVAEWAPTVVENGRRAARQFGLTDLDVWPWDSEAATKDEAAEQEPKAEEAPKPKTKSSTAEKSTAKKSSAKTKSKATAKKKAKKSTKKATAKKSTAKKATAKKTAKKKAPKKSSD